MKKVLVLVAFLLVACLAQAEEPGVSADLSLTFGQIGELLKTNLDANTVLGTPIPAGDVTLIPIVARGFGFGLGERVRSETEVKAHDKASKEGEKGNKGIGAGAGGMARPIAILVVKKDGHVQLMRLQPEGWISQAISTLVPVLQNAINKQFEMRRLKMEEKKASQPDGTTR